MIRYTKTKVIRITEVQHKTLVKMKSMNVNTGDFIRKAIKEKIDRDYSYMMEKKKELDDPFLHSLNMALERINNS